MNKTGIEFYNKKSGIMYCRKEGPLPLTKALLFQPFLVYATRKHKKEKNKQGHIKIKEWDRVQDQVG